jgi:imidazole glycerol-phosphate synthase subunit HisH
MSRGVTILDYGMCNLLNVARAFQHVGAEVLITQDPAVAARSDRLVVPGVGAFRDSVDAIRRYGFDNTIADFVRTGRPFLGICVGMQMLFDASEEFGDHDGLGILAGRVQAVPNASTDGAQQRVPHIGWNHLEESEDGRSWTGTLLEPNVGTRPAVYFVHSFAAVPSQQSHRLADCSYGGHRLCAAIEHENIMATQFHPERSGEIGLNILRRYLST